MIMSFPSVREMARVPVFPPRTFFPFRRAVPLYFSTNSRPRPFTSIPEKPWNWSEPCDWIDLGRRTTNHRGASGRVMPRARPLRVSQHHHPPHRREAPGRHLLTAEVSTGCRSKVTLATGIEYRGPEV